jgi:hypothetical protein
MSKNISRHAKRAGFTLITALAFSLVVGTVLAGVGTVALSHFGRSKVEGDYADTMALADGGINYEIAAASRDLINLSGVNQMGNPHVGTITGIPGTYSVYVRPWGTGCNGLGNWAPPTDVCVVSTGTVNGISRTVEARGKRKSLFDEYAIYAYSVAVVNGVGASGNTGVDGNMGANGSVTFQGALGSGAVLGTLSLNGGGASVNNNAGNVQSNPDALVFPTVSQVANAMFPGGGLTWLQTHNSNASIMMLKSADPTLATEPTVAGITLADVNSKLTTAGFTVASRSVGSAPITDTKDTSALDNASGGTRFVMAAGPHGGTPVGVGGTPVYFFPPGDYYFSDLNFLNKGSWVILTHLGDVRFWVDSAAAGNDDISKLNVVFSDPTASKFRLYYNKCGTVTMRGQAVFSGSIYGIKSGCVNGPGVDLEGGDEIYGSVIVNTFTTGGGSWVVFPNNGGNDNSSDPSLWYGFKDNWKEIRYDGSNNPVFADGTSN